MDAVQPPQRPTSALDRQHSFSADDEATLRASNISSQPNQSESEYNPCQNAKIISPFYMYNHDSPRPSQDLRQPCGKPSIHLDVRDLEFGDMTPTVSQEKLNAQLGKKSLGDRLKFWKQKNQHCMTKPKKQNWLQRLPKKQRLMVKLLIAFLVTGAMVGIAVGIAAAVHSGIYGSGRTIGGQ